MHRAGAIDRDTDRERRALVQLSSGSGWIDDKGQYVGPLQSAGV